MRRDNLGRDIFVRADEYPECPGCVRFFNEHHSSHHDCRWFECDRHWDWFSLAVNDHDCQFADHLYASTDESELAPESLLRQRNDGDGDTGDATTLAG